MKELFMFAIVIGGLVFFICFLMSIIRNKNTVTEKHKPTQTTQGLMVVKYEIKK